MKIKRVFLLTIMLGLLSALPNLFAPPKVGFGETDNYHCAAIAAATPILVAEEQAPPVAPKVDCDILAIYEVTYTICVPPDLLECKERCVFIICCACGQITCWYYEYCRGIGCEVIGRC